MSVIKKILKVVGYVFTALLLIVVAYGGYFYFAAVRPLQQGTGMFAGGGDERLSPEPVHFVLAGEDFWIPKYYLLLPIEKEKEPSLIDVYVNWPDMKPQIEERKDRELAQKNIKQSITVVLNNKSKTNLRKPTVLETWLDISDDVYGRDYVKTGEIKYGLVQYRTSRSEERGMYTEMYKEKDSNGTLKSFILCSECQENPNCQEINKRWTENPTCESNQEIGKFMIRIRFNKKYLSEWKMIQQKGNALIETFKVNPVKK